MTSRAPERDEHRSAEDAIASSAREQNVAAYLRDRASPYAARVSAWWLEVTEREGCKPMSYYDQ